MPLDSDTSNADAQLHVTFYEADFEPYKGVPFIRIMVPGDKTNIIEQPVKDHHKRRFAQKWLAYQMANGSENVVGVPLKQWNEEKPDQLTRGQLDELFALGFRTVEQVASANDRQIQRIGMGAAGLREKAKTYLGGKNSIERSSEMDAMKEQLARMEQLLAAASQPKAKGKPGRKPGYKKVTVNVHDDITPTGATGL
jgi:hypothetical protein